MLIPESRLNDGSLVLTNSIFYRHVSSFRENILKPSEAFVTDCLPDKQF